MRSELQPQRLLLKVEDYLVPNQLRQGLYMEHKRQLLVGDSLVVSFIPVTSILGVSFFFESDCSPCAGSTQGFGAQQAPGTGQGTGGTPYSVTTVLEPPKEEGKPDPPNQVPHQFHSISTMPAYKNYSFEVRFLRFLTNQDSVLIPQLRSTGASLPRLSSQSKTSLSQSHSLRIRYLPFRCFRRFR